MSLYTLQYLRKLILFVNIFLAISVNSYCGVAISSTNLTGYHCNNGSITLNVNSQCGGGIEIAAPWYGNIGGWIPLNNGIHTVSYLAAGTYTISISEPQCPFIGNYISYSFTVTLTEPPCATEITSFIKVQDVTKWLCSNGKISVTANGLGCDSNLTNLNWKLFRDNIEINQSNFSNSPITPGTPLVFDNLDTGEYYVIVSNGLCGDTSTIINISQPSCSFSIDSFTKIQDVTNWQCSNGQIAVSATSTDCSGQLAPMWWSLDHIGWGSTYSFSLSDYIQSGVPKLFSNLDSGSYRIIVAGDNCFDTSAIIHVTSPECGIELSVLNSFNSDNIACDNGSVTLMPTISSNCFGGFFEYSRFRNGQLEANSTLASSFFGTSQTLNLPGGNHKIIIGTNGCQDSVEFTINCIFNPILVVKLFIQGYYIGTNSMTPTLLNQGVLSNSLITDSITIELRDPIIPMNTVFLFEGIVQTDGNITCNFPYSALGNSYYLVVRNRNAIETWSEYPVTISGNTFYDFTDLASKAFGSNQVELETGIWGLFSGDLNHDENIDLLDLSELESDINNFQFGNQNTDLNGDGNVDLLDSPVLENNVNEFIFSNHP